VAPKRVRKIQSKNETTTLTSSALGPILSGVRDTNIAVARAFPGETGDRQPVHTVYGGAHLFKSDSAARMGAVALATLDEYAPDAETFRHALGLGSELPREEATRLADTVRARVAAKLQREPVEDFRIDFEDGYGVRPDAEEDGHARAAAEEMARGLAAGTLPPFVGIRIKPMSKELHARSLRTLDLFVSTLVRTGTMRLPPNFVITVPKLMSQGHVTAVARACIALERGLKLHTGALKLELMIETPQSILAPDGSSALRPLVAAGSGRVTGAHFGTYDYTALCGITASWQHMRHQACDFAKHMMQVAFAQSGIRLSDGATNVMPIPPHKAAAGRTLTDAERRENRDVVHRAWKLHYNDIQHSLVNGFYQGWDLHPAQLPTRYAAVAAFFLSALPAATTRLRNFVDKAAQATLVGDVFDDAATGQGLLNFFVRGLTSGALTLDEARETGLTREELQSRSFVKILQSRKANASI
jgi:citrate lyase beta subunit